MENNSEALKDLEMFGCDPTQLVSFMPPCVEPLMFAMGILSDAQHLLETGQDRDKIRQYINRAKYVMSQEIKKHR